MGTWYICNIENGFRTIIYCKNQKQKDDIFHKYSHIKNKKNGCYIYSLKFVPEFEVD